ncbi:MotB family protein [Limoniibacter endophyticus]|uniref:Flagellar motor protein MotB n=1 Tax=Limoniibacter endophyticus TaxID=1565040 RepID=A0A8J3DGC9_9HYPH|nr:MotB family protein [Limoniibacter endophyticus]GHC64520.1 flagellar motor protein MotB [Limoniibacter endophyticus]
MSFPNPDRDHQEIIIVRRGHDDEHEHHGGVWKIAFADFMTAMMCFFLVMWLINAASDETKTSVASYFNPVRLVDPTAGTKGVETLKHNTDGNEEEGTPKTERTDNFQTKGSSLRRDAGTEAVGDLSPSEQFTDGNLFSNPYAVLAEIAAETGMRQNLSDKGDGGASIAGPATGAAGGESYRDPFAPDFWSREMNHAQIEETFPVESAATQGTTTPPTELERQDTSAQVKAEEEETQYIASAAAPSIEQAEAAIDKNALEPTSALNQRLISAETLAQEIAAELSAALSDSEALKSSLSVVATEEGVAISLTDQMNFGMFEIGSAVPRRELVLAMEKIAATLVNHPGNILVGGHTDARPFRNETYDNWRLSSARAQSAYYMLVRGGLGEQRVKEIRGFADRKPKIPEDTYAAANRRIEILLEPAG